MVALPLLVMKKFLLATIYPLNIQELAFGVLAILFGHLWHRGNGILHPKILGST
jgi:uncharacterized membrane protein